MPDLSIDMQQWNPLQILRRRKSKARLSESVSLSPKGRLDSHTPSGAQEAKYGDLSTETLVERPSFYIQRDRTPVSSSGMIRITETTPSQLPLCLDTRPHSPRSLPTRKRTHSIPSSNCSTLQRHRSWESMKYSKSTPSLVKRRKQIWRRVWLGNELCAVEEERSIDGIDLEDPLIDPTLTTMAATNSLLETLLEEEDQQVDDDYEEEYDLSDFAFPLPPSPNSGLASIARRPSQSEPTLITKTNPFDDMVTAVSLRCDLDQTYGEHCFGSDNDSASVVSWTISEESTTETLFEMAQEHQTNIRIYEKPPRVSDLLLLS